MMMTVKNNDEDFESFERSHMDHNISNLINNTEAKDN